MDQVADFLHELRANLTATSQRRVVLVDALLAEHQVEPISAEAFAPYLHTIASGSWKLAISNQTLVRAEASEMLLRWMAWRWQKRS